MWRELKHLWRVIVKAAQSQLTRNSQHRSRQTSSCINTALYSPSIAKSTQTPFHSWCPGCSPGRQIKNIITKTIPFHLRNLDVLGPMKWAQVNCPQQLLCLECNAPAAVVHPQSISPSWRGAPGHEKEATAAVISHQRQSPPHGPGKTYCKSLWYSIPQTWLSCIPKFTVYSLPIHSSVKHDCVNAQIKSSQKGRVQQHTQISFKMLANVYRKGFEVLNIYF